MYFELNIIDLERISSFFCNVIHSPCAKCSKHIYVHWTLKSHEWIQSVKSTKNKEINAVYWQKSATGVRTSSTVSTDSNVFHKIRFFTFGWPTNNNMRSCLYSCSARQAYQNLIKMKNGEGTTQIQEFKEQRTSGNMYVICVQLFLSFSLNFQMNAPPINTIEPIFMIWTIWLNVNFTRMAFSRQT